MMMVMILASAYASGPPPPPMHPPAPAGAMNVMFIAVDDLRAQFGRSFQTPEVLTPHMDTFFLEGGGSAMQHSYVQIAVCGPSRYVVAHLSPPPPSPPPPLAIHPWLLAN
jgi:hypothetical protein